MDTLSDHSMLRVNEIFFNPKTNSMKFNFVFIVTAILYGFLGLATIFFTKGMLDAAGIESEIPYGVIMALRFSGVEMFGLAIIAWCVRNAAASQAKAGVSLGFAIYFLCHALTSLYAQFTDPSNKVHWVAATIQILLAIGFFMVSRSNDSKSAG